MAPYNPRKYLTSRDTIRAFVLLYGDLTEGIKVVGPFTDPDFVPVWAERMGLKEGQYWLSYLYHPMD